MISKEDLRKIFFIITFPFLGVLFIIAWLLITDEDRMEFYIKVMGEKPK